MGRATLPPSVMWLPAALPLALLWPPLLHAVESRMVTHMLVEWPLLLLAGMSLRWLLHRTARLRQLDAALALIDWRGWTSATLLLCVSVYWMIPSSLDAALLAPWLNVTKIASWWFAGLLLGDGLRRMEPEVLLFMVGNIAWMTATAGLLYIEAPERLCVNYLIGEQRIAGGGLVALSVAALLAALMQAARGDKDVLAGAS